MDDHFSIFLEEFGKGKCAEVAEATFFEKYAGRLPSSLLSLIKQDGFASYAEGIFWTVNPDKFSSYAEAWCSRLESLAGKHYLVFGRSAFGDLYALQESSGRVVTVSFVTGLVWGPKNLAKPPKNFEIGVQSFFGSAFKTDFDMEDELGSSLFKRGVSLFGPIGSNEMFGFEPALSIGGKISSENLRKLRFDVHIDMLSQLTEPVFRTA